MTPTTPTPRRLRVAAGSAVLALALAACGSSGSTGSSGETSAASSASSAATTAAATASSAAETTAAAASTLKVSGAWARTSAATQDAGAAYLKIENTGDTDDALVSAKAPETVAMMTQIHEVVPDTSMGASTTAMGGSMDSSATTAMGGSMDSSATTMAGGMGAMKMQEVDKIVVPAKGSVELKPGGYHIMLMKLAKPLVKGETFDVTLTFASGATQVVSVEVRDEA